jgi:hypothetical protein
MLYRQNGTCPPDAVMARWRDRCANFSLRLSEIAAELALPRSRAAGPRATGTRATTASPQGSPRSTASPCRTDRRRRLRPELAPVPPARPRSAADGGLRRRLPRQRPLREVVRHGRGRGLHQRPAALVGPAGRPDAARERRRSSTRSATSACRSGSPPPPATASSDIVAAALGAATARDRMTGSPPLRSRRPARAGHRRQFRPRPGHGARARPPGRGGPPGARSAGRLEAAAMASRSRGIDGGPMPPTSARCGALAALAEDAGPIDILVNAAGMNLRQPFGRSRPKPSTSTWRSTCGRPSC